MFSRQNQLNSNNNITKESILNEITERYRDKQRNSSVIRTYQNNLHKNILLIGRQHIGKTTLKNVLENPCYIPNDSTLFSRIPSTILHPTFSLSDSDLSLTIIETSELFNRSSSRQKDVSIDNINRFCIDNDIKQIHSICFCTSFESGINNEDIDILHKFVNHFGEQICSYLCLIITRCELKDNQQRNHLLEELKYDRNFQTIIPYFHQRIYFTGSISQDGLNRKDLELVISQFETVYDYRRNLIQFIQNATNSFNIEQQRQQSQLEENRLILPDTFRSNKRNRQQRKCFSIGNIVILSILLFLLYIFVSWWINQLEISTQLELDKDWIDHFNGGSQAVNHLNRLIIFSSRSNLQLNSNDEFIELHSLLSQQSIDMKIFLKKFNQINNLILENSPIWLSSFDSIQNEFINTETLNFFWKNITNIKEIFERFYNEFPLEQNSQFIHILTTTYSKKKMIYNETLNQFPSDEQIHKQIEEINSKLKFQKFTEEHYDKMLILYKNRQETKENVEKALVSVKKARQEHNHAYTCLQSTFDQNQTLQFEQIEQEYDLEFLEEIIEEMDKLYKYWSHFHQFLAILSRHIQFTKQVINEELLNCKDDQINLIRRKSSIVNECYRQMKLIHQLCQALHISMKFMIEQLNTNGKYFLLKNDQEQNDHLQQLNHQTDNLLQNLSSLLRSLIEFTQVEEK